MRRGERRKGWRKFWKNDDKQMDEMDRKECRKMMKTNKGRRWKMKKNVGWGVCMKQFICGARPSTTLTPPTPHPPFQTPKRSEQKLLPPPRWQDLLPGSPWAPRRRSWQAENRKGAGEGKRGHMEFLKAMGLPQSHQFTPKKKKGGHICVLSFWRSQFEGPNDGF